VDINQYLSVFIDESKEHLQAMNENLLELENRPDDIGIIQHIFRSAHTLKGMSATMGFEDIAALTHEMENVLDQIRNRTLNVTPAVIDSLFRCFDQLDAMVGDIVQGGTGKADIADILDSLHASTGSRSGETIGLQSGSQSEEHGEPHQLSNGESQPAKVELDEFQYSVLSHSLTVGIPVYYIEVVLREDCILKAARAYIVFDQLGKNGEILKSEPAVQDIEQELFDHSFSVFYASELSSDELTKVLSQISEVERIVVDALNQEKLDALRDGGQMQVSSETPQAEQTQQQSGLGGSSSPMEALPAPPSIADPAIAPDVTPAASAAASAQSTVSAGRTIRVDSDRLDNLMNLFSELLIDRSRLEQLSKEIKNADLSETVEHMSRISGELQNLVLNMRLMPVESVLNRFPRMIRDIAKGLNKKINLVMTGAETELDRAVIEEIGDPLVHLLRNAADHGLESTTDRLASGKAETGIIHLRAYRSGNHVHIDIEDDGAGIDRNKVLKKALGNRLVTSEQAVEMTDDQVFQLLFQAGFSTADKISDLSGRGVGLDVVKTKIASLGGHVEVTSRQGVGTRFTIQLPLTISIIGVLLIRSGIEKYVIPLSSVVETALVEPHQVSTVQGNPMIEFRDKLIPLIYLSELFDVPPSDQQETPELEIVIVRKGERMLAIEVDELFSQQEIVLKPMGGYLSHPFAVAGATILGNGQVALVIDTNALFK
jgi:two-component system chemotaxis sensor kinase CheA